MTATAQHTRYAAYLTGGSNDDYTHAWIDAAPHELKQELARIHANYTKFAQTKKGRKVIEKKGYASAEHVGGYSLALTVGTSSHPDLDFYTQKTPYDQFVAVPHDPDHNHDDHPAGINPEQWNDQKDDDYALRVTDKGVYFVVSASWDDDDELDETPVIPYDFIK